MDTQVNDKTMQVVNFSTRDIRGSIEISYVSKVIAIPRISPAPSGPPYMIGLLNIAGEIIPVIDLSMRLLMSNPSRYEINTPILVCRNDKNKLFGLVVEQVYQIESINEKMIQKENLEGMDHQFVIGAIKYENSISVLLDINAVTDINT